jgi:hypothetical protein
MSGQEAVQQIEQTRPDRKPCGLKMEVAAPAVLIGEDVSIAGGDGVAGGRQVQIEPRAHVYVAGLAPIKTGMRKHDFCSADEEGEKGERCDPVRDAHEGGVALRVRVSYRTKFGRRRQITRTEVLAGIVAVISDRQTCIHKVDPIPDGGDSTAMAQLLWGLEMRIALIVLLGAASAFGQGAGSGSMAGNATAACGSEYVSFKLRLDKSPHTLTQPEARKARVYFFHDAGTGYTLGYPTVKVAVDGAWLGANHGNTYFSATVDPGEHHVCVTLQSSLVAQRVELAHFTAEADKVYCFRTQLVMSRSVELLELEPLDSDQGKYLIGSFALSVSSVKK